ncbi:MAG TPA: protein kinase, partial [Kofleriaceae bacterium]|nr:protein kinase [Kofleriaceae bacterium]
MALFEGALPPVTEKEVEAHAASCSACRRLLAELARSPSMAARSPTIPNVAGDAHIDLEPGDKVDRFSILGRLGHGGMGVVFSAYDPRLDRKVALKLLRSSDDSKLTPEEAQARLLREAQALAQQSHPNVIAVYDVGTYKSEVYIAMELVEGKTLGQWLRAYQRSHREILDKFVQAGKALAAAHGSGLVHRDFKPENVLVGDDDRVRVMDFGLARSLFYDIPEESLDPMFRIAVDGVSELNRDLTATGAVLGTPRYMAPEQFLGRLADARSDQFSFCVALWEALYGERPFPGVTAGELAAAVRTGRLREPPDISDRGVPAWLK